MAMIAKRMSSRNNFNQEHNHKNNIPRFLTQKAKRISKATANLSTGKQKALAVDKAVKSHKQSKQSDDKAIT